MYEARFKNETTGEGLTIMQWEWPNFLRFTKRQYDIILAELFFLAAESYENCQLSAEIYRDGEKLHTIVCETKSTNYPEYSLDAFLYVDGTYVRTMNIAA